MSDYTNNQTLMVQIVKDELRPRLPITCTELLRQEWVTCSCCGRDAQPRGSLVTTGGGDRVDCILCRQHEGGLRSAVW